MSSTIKIVPNAAAIAWGSLVNAIDARALMEGSMLSIFADDMKASIKQTGTQSASAASAGSNAAWQQGLTGAFTMLGALVGTGYDTFKTTQANSALTEAQNASFKDTTMEIEEVNSSSSSTSELDSVEEEEGTVEIEGKLNPASKSTSDPLTKAQEKTIKEAKQRANKYTQDGQVYSQIISRFVEGLGSAWAAKYTSAKARDDAAQALAQGIAQTFNSEVSQVSSAIGSCDSNMQGANQALQSLIGASAVRG